MEKFSSQRHPRLSPICSRQIKLKHFFSLNSFRASVSSLIICASALFLSAITLSSCGSGSDGFRGEYRVNETDIDRTSFPVGSTSRVDVFFESKRDAIGLPDDVVVVLRLSPEISYVENSGELFDGSTSDRDGRDPDEVLPCPDGSSFVIFRFDDDELDDRRILGGDNGLRIEIKGESVALNAEVEAAADDNQGFSCEENFDEEKSDTTEIT